MRTSLIELPNPGALDLLPYHAPAGGGTASFKTDAQGRSLSTALLRMEVEVPDATI